MAENYANPSFTGSSWEELLKYLGGNNYQQYTESIPWWGRDYFEKNPESGWNNYLNFAVANQPKNMQNWAQNRFPEYYSKYQTMAQLDPTLFWTDYVKTLNPEADFGKASPYERGQKP